MSSESNNDKHTPIKRKWLYLPVLDMYVFKEFITPFAVLILAFILLFLVADIFNDLQDFLEVNAPFKVIFKYFILKLPGNIRFILPISILLACMYTMANFGKNLEVTAMRASGVSLLRCGGSIYLVAIVITGINFWFNEGLVPKYEREAYILRRETKNPDFKKEEHNMLTYRSPDKRRTWLFTKFTNESSNSNVILKLYRADGTLEWDIKAETAEFTKGEGWIFRKVVMIPYNANSPIHGRPVHKEVLVKSLDEFPETITDITNAIKPPEELPTYVILDIIKRTKNMPKILEDKYKTIFYWRLAFPWSCLIAVFLAIPLAAKNERGGIFMSIIIAVVIIVVYQMSSNIFKIMGQQGVLHPIVAGIGPTLAFILYGWFNVSRQS